MQKGMGCFPFRARQGSERLDSNLGQTVADDTEVYIISTV